MRNPMAVVAALLTALMVWPALAQQPAPSREDALRAELVAAWQAANKAGTAGPADVPLIDQAVLKLRKGVIFVPKAEAARVLRALGNRPGDATLVGIVISPRASDNWIAVINHIKEGYIKDDDAKTWNADDLLKTLKEGTEEANKERVARGFPEMQVIGWQQPPAYDATTHRLVWSLLAKDKGEPDDAPKNINYNTYALGRDGYFSLNLLTGSDTIAADKAVAHELLADLSYNAGKRYEDFSASTDRVAEYGLIALIGGVAAKKLGLFALLAATLLKFGKIILVGAAVAGGTILKLFRRKPRQDTPDGAA